MSDRQKIIAALIASVLLHVIGFFLVLLWSTRHHSSPLENLKLVEVSVATPTPEPAQVLPRLPLSAPPMIDSTGLNKTKKAPGKPVFQSDENSVAASELDGLGRIPLPTQNGKERPQLAFDTQRVTLGNGSSSAAAPPVMTFAPAPDLPPVTREKSRPTPAPKAARATPTPAPTVAPTPQPQQMAKATPVPEPSAAAEPLYKPTPVPSATVTPQPTPDFARPTPVATPKPAESLAMLTTPVPRPSTPPERAVQPQRPQQPGYHPDTEQNKIVGGISNRGRTGVDAISTPIGRYQKKISDAIGPRWYYYVNSRMDLITVGSVRIRFYINEHGHVEDLKVISNESNETLANYSVQAITAARIPPPPPELAPSLDNGRYEVTYTFTVYPN